jgi:hypothetical protein
MNLDALRGWMAGEDCVVVATGPSAYRVSPGTYESHWTIGCGGAIAFCRPDFALCIGARKDKYWPYVKASSPLFVFTHIPKRHPRAIRFSTNLYDWLPPPEGAAESLVLGMSPFYGVAVAIALGFETIGIIGVDLDGDGGRYSDERFQKKWELEWGWLAKVAENAGAQLLNLNVKSKLQALPKGGWPGVRGKRG